MRCLDRLADVDRLAKGRRAALLLIAGFLLFALLGHLAVYRAQSGSADFDGFWEAARLYHLGQRDVYKGTALKNYLPCFTILLLPLGLITNIKAAAYLWFLVQWPLACFSLKWSLDLVGAREPGERRVVGAAAVLVLSPFFFGGLLLGQVNLLVLWLTLLALRAVSRGKDIRGGLSLSLAIALKLTPALFALYFLYRARGRVLLGCAAGLVLIVYLLPGFALGFENHHDQLREWKEERLGSLAESGTIPGGISRSNNRSLLGLLSRYLIETPRGIGDLFGYRIWFCRIAQGSDPLSPEAFGWLFKGCALVIVLVSAWACRTPVPRFNTPPNCAGEGGT